MRHDLEHLIKDHENLEEVTGRLIAAVNAPEQDVPAIVMLRSELAIALDDHLAKEDGLLYTDALRANESDFVSAVDKFESDFAKLSVDWQDYLAEWPADVIAQDFDTFREDTLELLARLAARISHENRLLYPIALQQGRIVLRPAR